VEGELGGDVEGVHGEELGDDARAEVLARQRELVAYLQQLHERRDKWADACVRVATFGIKATSCAEGFHARFKRFYLRTSTGDLLKVVEAVEEAALDEGRKVDRCIDQNLNRRNPYLAENPVFLQHDGTHLLDRVSPNAIRMVVSELAKARRARRTDGTFASTLPACTGFTRAVMGVPCSHELYSSLANPGYRLQVGDFHRHWIVDRLREGLTKPAAAPADPVVGQRTRLLASWTRRCEAKQTQYRAQ